MNWKFNTGDLVTVDEDLYPRLKGLTGVLIERAPIRTGSQWIVMIMNRMHPFYIDEGELARVQTAN
jgi:hypothetical protein